MSRRPPTSRFISPCPPTVVPVMSHLDKIKLGKGGGVAEVAVARHNQKQREKRRQGQRRRLRQHRVRCFLLSKAETEPHQAARAAAAAALQAVPPSLANWLETIACVWLVCERSALQP